MYGLINISIRDLVVEHFGREKWDHIKDAAAIDDDFFVSNKTYDDKVTYGLISAAARVLGLKSDRILRDFGRYWVLKVGPRGYGHILDAGGKTFEEFLLSLPSLHNRIVLIYPKLRPPQFQVQKVDEDTLILDYSSQRQGLIPFVEGLLEGLALRFGITIRLQYLGVEEKKGFHRFKIEMVQS